MTKYILDLSDEVLYDFNLISVKVPMEVYRFAFFLNKKLGIHLSKMSKGIALKQQIYYAEHSVYEFKDEIYKSDWYLISNKCIVYESLGLFTTFDARTYLIPEDKSIDFLIKIHGDLDENLIEKIKTIPQVEKVELIDVNSLSLKDYLI